MTALIYQHPVACAVALVIALYAVAIAALGWPFDWTPLDRKRA